MTDHNPLEIVALVLAAVGVGFAKTAVGGVSSISVALFATVLPARESTGALLLLLIVGDLVAVTVYRHHVDWLTLLRLFPSVAVGVTIGAGFVTQVSDTGMRRMIGVVLLALVTVHLDQRWRQKNQDPEALRAQRHRRRHRTAVAFGLLAGFTTMVANAGGPVMSLYLLSAGLGMLGFLGTTAWFFLTLNLFKVPFSLGLGLISLDSVIIDAWLVPAVLVGALLGRAVVPRLDQRRFEALVLLFVVLSGLGLLL